MSCKSRSITTSRRGPRQFTPEEIASFLQDERTAVNMLNSTFTNNISLTFNVGFGSFLLPGAAQRYRLGTAFSLVAYRLQW
jgi:hypothetical protein